MSSHAWFLAWINTIYASWLVEQNPPVELPDKAPEWGGPGRGFIDPVTPIEHYSEIMINGQWVRPDERVELQAVDHSDIVKHMGDAFGVSYEDMSKDWNESHKGPPLKEEALKRIAAGAEKMFSGKTGHVIIQDEVDAYPESKAAISPFGEEWKLFKVGDIVTRHGDDRQRILSTNAKEGQPGSGDLIECECIREPDLWGPDEDSWCKVGDREHFVAWRCSYPDEAIVDG